MIQERITKIIYGGMVMLKILMILALLLPSVFIAGCSTDTIKPVPPEVDTQEPVTLKFGLSKGGWLTEEELQKYVVDPVKKKYPYITISRVVMEPDEASLEKLMMQGEKLDLYITSSGRMGPFITMGLSASMDELIKKHNFPLSKMDAGSVEMMKSSSRGNLSALPYSSNFSVLYYNKDIFDKFGVPYPKDGMTWDDAVQLAEKVTRSESGVNYLGLNGLDVWRTATQMEVGFVDSTTKKALVNSDPWKKVFETYKKVFSIPGNEYLFGSKAANAFVKDKRMAMLAGGNMLQALQNAGMNWDMASYPAYKENPGKRLAYDLHVIGIIAGSNHKDAAFQVISTLLSEGVQLDMSRDGRIAILNGYQFKKQYGENLSFLNGKNLQAIFSTEPADRYSPTEFDVKSQTIVENAFGKVVQPGGLDINSALRNAEEEINSLVEQKQ
jgi:multiple sugar transport system substrate-binding protein